MNDNRIYTVLYYGTAEGQARRELTFMAEGPEEAVTPLYDAFKKFLDDHLAFTEAEAAKKRQ